MTPIPPPIPFPMEFPILLEPLTTEEQVRSLPNYTLMVQEAIIALGKGEKSNENFQGCSLLGIFLYILRQYPNTRTQDNAIVMNNKIRSSLALLKRMGIVKSINDELDDLEIESTLPSSIEPEPDTVSIFFSFYLLKTVQVNLFQKHSFLHQLTHNMTTDCSLNYQKNTSSEHVVYKNCFLFWHSKQFMYTTCF